MRSNRDQTEQSSKQFVPVPAVLQDGEVVLVAPFAVMGTELINPLVAARASRIAEAAR
jgi:predicted thioredoxin/glutaredoxin